MMSRVADLPGCHLGWSVSVMEKTGHAEFIVLVTEEAELGT